MSDPLPPPSSLDRIAVIGAGLMGHGIAVQYAVAGRDVTLYDQSEDVLTESEDRVRSAVETLERNDRLEDPDTVIDRIAWEDSLPEAAAGVDLVTEAVTEDLSKKRSVFESLETHAPASAVLATNTSGLSITELSEAVADPSRVLGTHWFNPPYVVPLVEVVRGEHTSEAVMDATYELLEESGKTAVRVEKDVPGFVGNRIQIAMAYEAFSLLDRGVASAEDIDKAVKAGFGFRLPTLGIFEKADQSGLEVHHEVERYLLPELDRGTDPNPVIASLLEEGSTGVESGKGVYDWSGLDPETVYERRDDALLSLLDTYERDLRD